MANTKVQYIGDASTDTFTVTFPYLEESDVHITVNGTPLLPTDYEFLTPSSVRIHTVPAQDDVIDIKRETEQNVRLVNYQDGAILTEQEMDLDSLQAFYLIQEAQENYADLINDALTAIAVANGVVVTDPEDILAALVTNMIGSAAANELQQRITDIDLNAEAILNNTTSLLDGDANLQSQINALAGSVAATVYVQPNEPIPGVDGVPDPIPDAARWYDSDDNNHPYIYDQANTQWLDLEDPRIGQNAADIVTLQADLTTAEGDIGVNASAIGVLDTTVTNIDGVVTGHTSDISQLQTDVGNNTTGVSGNASAISSLDTRVTTAEGDITTNASDITALETTVNHPTTGVGANATGLSALTTRVTTAEGDISTAQADILAQAGQITVLQSTIDLRNRTFAQDDPPTASNVGDLWYDTNDDNRLYRWDGNNWIDIRDAIIDANATAISSLDTIVTANQSGVSANASSITVLDSRLTTAEGDIASATVSIDANTLAISNAEGDITALEARYGVSLNVNGYITGFVQNNDGTSGEFVILADKFAIVDPSGDPGETQFVPFSVSNGVVSMQNVEISGDLMVDGSINGVKIGANELDDTHIDIAELSALVADLGTITAGNITLDSAGFIKTSGVTDYDTGDGVWIGYDSTHYKFRVGNMLDNYMSWDGTTLEVAGDLKVGEYSASDAIILSATTERTDSGPQGGLTKYKEFTVDRPGTVRCTVDYKCGTFSGGVVTACDWEIRKNSNVESSWSSSSQTSYTTRTVTSITVDVGDKISVWMHGGTRNPSEPIPVLAFVQNAYIKADLSLTAGGVVNLN